MTIEGQLYISQKIDNHRGASVHLTRLDDHRGATVHLTRLDDHRGASVHLTRLDDHRGASVHITRLDVCTNVFLHKVDKYIKVFAMPYFECH